MSDDLVRGVRGYVKNRSEEPHVRPCGTNMGHPAPLRFWQPRFYDFNVYSKHKKREKLEYMHANPIKRKLVRRPQDWPWSSYSFYASGEVGLIAVDAVDGTSFRSWKSGRKKKEEEEPTLSKTERDRAPSSQ